jgi:hypothetical protein
MIWLKKTFFFCRIKNSFKFAVPSGNNKAGLIRSLNIAGIAQLVEHDLAKVGVAGSSPVSRSIYLVIW